MTAPDVGRLPLVCVYNLPASAMDYKRLNLDYDQYYVLVTYILIYVSAASLGSAPGQLSQMQDTSGFTFMGILDAPVGLTRKFMICLQLKIR